MRAQECFWSAIGHSGFVRGIAPDADGNTFYTCGDDRMIKQWALQPTTTLSLDDNTEIKPLKTYMSEHTLTGIDHHWVDRQFASSGDAISLWDATRSDPIHTYKWTVDSILSVKFNPAEVYIDSSDARYYCYHNHYCYC